MGVYDWVTNAFQTVIQPVQAQWKKKSVLIVSLTVLALITAVISLIATTISYIDKYILINMNPVINVPVENLLEYDGTIYLPIQFSE
jgi:hypothetical protein